MKKRDGNAQPQILKMCSIIPNKEMSGQYFEIAGSVTLKIAKAHFPTEGTEFLFV